MTSDNSKGDDMNKQRILAISDLSMMTGGFGLAVDEDVKFAPNVHPLPDPPENKERRAKAQMARAEIEEEAQAILAEMDKEHVFIGLIGKKGPYVTMKVPDEVTKKRVTVTVSPETFRGNYIGKDNNIKNPETGKIINKADLWLANTTNRVSTITYDPSKAPGIIEDEHNDRLLNLWEGFAIEPKKGCWKRTQRHIYTILCNGDARKFKYVMKWLAWAIQNPHKRAEVVLVFKGKKGTGKSFLFKSLKRIFGIHGMVLSNPEALIGKFNAHFRRLSFLFCDEAYAPEDKKAEGKVKAIITEEFIETEGKFEDTTQMRNRLHIVMCTNNDRAIPATDDERRYFIEEVSDIYAKGGAKWREHNRYFKALWRELESEGGLEAMLYDLMNMNLGDWHPRDDSDVLQTNELKKQVSLNQRRANKEVMDGILELLEKGELECIEYYHKAWGEYSMHSELLWSHIFGSDLDERTRRSLNTMGGPILKKLGAASKQHTLRDRFKGRMRWSFPELKEMRKNWDDIYGKRDWYDNVKRDLDNAVIETENKELAHKGKTEKPIDNCDYDKWRVTKGDF